MKRLIVVVNDLERSGKSSIARAVHHHLTSECETESLLVTSDETNLTDEFEGDYWDLDEDLSLETVIDSIEENDAVVVDVHTGGARNWAEFCENTEFDNVLADLGAEMTLVVPNTGGIRCNEEISDIVDLFADSADYIIAHTNTADRDQIDWKGSDAQKATRNLGSIEVNFPTVSSELETALGSAGRDMCEALTNAEALPRFAEIKISQWLEEVSARLEDADEFINAEGAELALEY